MDKNGNQILINPENGMIFSKGNEDVIKLNIQDGSATFKGTIDTKKDTTVGRKVILRDSSGSDALGLTAATNAGICEIAAYDGRYLNLECGKAMVNSDNIITENSTTITQLRSDIRQLKLVTGLITPSPSE